MFYENTYKKLSRRGKYEKGNKNNIVYIVIACIVAIVLLALAGVSLYKVINIENDSIPEVISEIDNSKKIQQN